MIIKGSSRGQSAGDAARLAKHLLAAENESVSVIELRGVSAMSLPDALEELRLVSLGTRARRGLYHASINLDRDEASELGDQQWIEAVDELERHLTLVGHQRCIVRHVKRGRSHAHIVWSRVNPTTLKVVHDGQNYRKHEECSRVMEARWQMRAVVGAHTREPGTPRPVACATHGDWQAQERTGIKVGQIAIELQRCWQAAPNGKAFTTAVQAAGLSLANGRRGIVVVDAAGTPHSLPRRLGLRAAEVRRKLQDLDPQKLSTVEDIKTAYRRQPRKGESMATQYGARRAPRRKRPVAQIGAEPNRAEVEAIRPDYWTGLGFEVEWLGPVLLVKLSKTTRLEDRGDRLTLIRDGEPTDEEIKLLVAAGRERGWENIRFFGGSPEYQKRARLEAIRQGYPLDQISLECEDDQRRPLGLAMPMPEHIRRKIQPPKDVPEPPAPSVPDTPAPSREFRP